LVPGRGKKLGEARGDGRERPAYRRISALLRAAVEEGQFEEGERLPTEAELSLEHRVSRHTVRQAFQDLVADGLVYRVPGRGTFVTGLSSRRGRYLRSVGTLEEMMTWAGTEMEVLAPPETYRDPEAASRLALPSAEVAKLVVRRSFEGNPFAVTDVYLDPGVGGRMRAEGSPPDGPGTVMSAVQDFLPLPVAGASLEVTAVSAPADISALMDCEPGEAILHVERLYYDSAGTFVGFAVSHYNPRRYSYRLELRRRTTP
jgi:GntR family transcriptional regulator